MRDFEIPKLYSLHGHQGVFRFKGDLRGGKFLFERLIDPVKKIIMSDRTGISKFKDVSIYIKGQEEPVALESVIETLYEMADRGTGIPDNLEKLKSDQTCKDTWPTVEKFMEEVVPGYDQRFKPYHMDKILKWYHEIVEALALIDLELEETDNN